MVAMIFGTGRASERVVRPPALAGTWYPAQPDELSRFVDKLLAQSDPIPNEAKNPPIRAILVPHAGYRFSGPTAITALKPLMGMRFKRVIVLGPSHQQGFEGLALPNATHFRTPLGEIALDTEAMERLKNHPLIHPFPGAHQQEHSIEIQLPLLQKVLAEGWQLLPILVGQMDAQGFAMAAESLRPLLDEETLLVISGDFTHYGKNFSYQPFPIDANIQDSLKKLDLGAVDKILRHDPKGFMDYQQETGITACAFGPVLVLLNLINPRVEPRLLQYHTSGSGNGDFSHSVSYVAMTFHSAQPLMGAAPRTEALPEDAMRQLHALAVATVIDAVTHNGTGNPPARLTHFQQLQQRFQEPSGAFVTLKRSGALRGCIGQLMPVQPLYRAVMEHAVNAALRDTRFQPVTPDELKEIELEVSVLSPMRPIPSWEAFILGQQGVVLSKNGRRAVFLPEVAVEQGWTREETLNHLALKAGLPQDAWRQGATFEVFTSQTYTAPLMPAVKPSGTSGS
ncbi:MAG: AmmeMemoRadiSam system protein B [Magnetococcales bacterium]|nr:AmmeMemoRadiSam system protein B [Magnetococcales bacterium]MBF0148921.1 AmmeMemoRadiSam system protein B [Magnetococcales bacterium]